MDHNIHIYKTIIELFKECNPDICKQCFIGALTELFQILKSQDLTEKQLSPEIAEYILGVFVDPNLTELYRIKYTNYLIYYIKHLSTTILNTDPVVINKPELEIVEPIIEEGCEVSPEDMIHLNPDDFKDMEIDEEFENLINPKKDIVDDNNR